jgi:hypothetical protein
MSDHAAYEELIARRDELSIPERATLQSHLTDCESCSLLAARYADQDAALRSFAVVQPAPHLQPRVFLQLGGRQSKSRRLLVAGTAALVAALLVISVGVVALRHVTTQAADTCQISGSGWKLVGPCRVLDSPAALRHPGIVIDRPSLAWVHGHVSHPQYLIYLGSGYPSIISHHQPPVYFSEVALDTRSHARIYAVGRGRP